MITVIPPVPSRTDEYFWQAARESRLVARRCAGCGALQHPPTPMCPHCQSLDFTVEDLSGRGVIHSWIVSRHPSVSDSDSRIVALIDLEEGIRMVSNIAADPATPVRTGVAVRVTFAQFGDVTLPQFVIDDEVA
ncbi:MAG TPA: zinc ribbon domain-containing protein [Mycobacterium sp.]|jgi:uncharacterized OB-fold protein|nr:zinc ribbon domain-containing protein [Mycobacterium sp.]